MGRAQARQKARAAIRSMALAIALAAAMESSSTDGTVYIGDIWDIVSEASGQRASQVDAAAGAAMTLQQQQAGPERAEEAQGSQELESEVSSVYGPPAGLFSGSSQVWSSEASQDQEDERSRDDCASTTIDHSSDSCAGRREDFDASAEAEAEPASSLQSTALHRAGGTAEEAPMDIDTAGPHLVRDAGAQGPSRSRWKVGVLQESTQSSAAAPAASRARCSEGPCRQFPVAPVAIKNNNNEQQRAGACACA